MSRVPGEVVLTWRADEWKAKAIPALNAGLFAASTVAAAEASENISRPFPPASRPGEMPHRDQGTLERSIVAVRPEALGTPLRAAFGTAVHYGRKLEFGGFIRARGKALKIPIDRKLARQANRGNWPLTLIKRRGRPPLLARVLGAGRTARRGKGGNYAGGSRIQPIFVLKKQVYIAPRPWIVRSALMARQRMQAAFVQVAAARLKAGGLSQ